MEYLVDSLLREAAILRGDAGPGRGRSKRS
jgi:hypothetical protein